MKSTTVLIDHAHEAFDLDTPSDLPRGLCLYWTPDPSQGDALRGIDVPACSPAVPHWHPEYRDAGGKFIELARRHGRIPVAILDRDVPIPMNIPDGVKRVVRINIDRVIESRTVLFYRSPLQHLVHAPIPAVRKRRRILRSIPHFGPLDPNSPSAADIASVRVAPTASAAMDDIYTTCETLPPPLPRPQGPAVRTLIDSAANASLWLATEPPPLNPIIEALFDSGDKVALIGASKSRKTFLALQLAIGLAAGLRSFLGWNITRARRVLMVQLEVAPHHFHRRFRRMVNAVRVSANEIGDRLQFLNGRGAIPTFAEIQAAALEHRAEVVILDPFYKLSRGDENAAADVKLTLAEFDRLAEATGAAVIFIYHEKKGSAGDRDARDRGAGSGVLARDFDAGLFVAEHRDDNDTGSLFVVKTVLRNYPPRAPIVVRFNEGCFDVAEGVAPVERTSRNAAKQADRLPDTAALAVFQRGPLPAGTMWADLEERGFTNRAARRAVSRLCDAGALAVHVTATVPPRRMHGLPQQIEAIKSAKSASDGRNV